MGNTPSTGRVREDERQRRASISDSGSLPQRRASSRKPRRATNEAMGSLPLGSSPSGSPKSSRIQQQMQQFKSPQQQAQPQRDHRHRLNMVDEDAEDGPSRSAGESAIAPGVTLGGAAANAGASASDVTFGKDLQANVVPTILQWRKGGTNVSVVGSFTGWTKKLRLSKSSHDFSTIINLPPGTHRLKFQVDGEYRCSDELPTATDSVGNLVNYVEVSEEDFALNNPDMEGGAAQSALSPRGESSTFAYVDEVPAFIRNDNAPIFQRSQEYTAPGLPPQLEKVILNTSNTMTRDDQSVLANPNHVVLNHLAATSVKNNVLAVSATTRYHRKYVTTILYTPVDKD